jgi:hypothetical protein
MYLVAHHIDEESKQTMPKRPCKPTSRWAFSLLAAIRKGHVRDRDTLMQRLLVD